MVSEKRTWGSQSLLPNVIATFLNKVLLALTAALFLGRPGTMFSPTQNRSKGCQGLSEQRHWVGVEIWVGVPAVDILGTAGLRLFAYPMLEPTTAARKENRPMLC